MAKPGLSKKQRRKLGTYIREIADTLNLRDWMFSVLHAPLPSGTPALAEITVTFGRAHAVIQFADYTATLPRHELREIVVHELLHCYIAGDKHGYGLDELLGVPAAHVWRAAWTADIERATDGIANAVAKLLPLPPHLK